MVYLFDAPNQGLAEQVVFDLRKAIQEWIEAYPASSLEASENEDGITIIDRRIRVNSIAPGVTDMPLFDKYGIPPDDLATMKDVIASDIPLGRLADATDIAAAITFLASPNAAYITAGQLTVDGDWTRL
ncbi:SDR family oxidoreductase [Kibdelosporangium aridum]|uniref:SDR family oxidoreductase n=1 Tax=Kibdelosporangium aridum TaxID=2030 RepID=UPI0035EEDA67